MHSIVTRHGSRYSDSDSSAVSGIIVAIAVSAPIWLLIAAVVVRLF